LLAQGLGFAEPRRPVVGAEPGDDVPFGDPGALLDRQLDDAALRFHLQGNLAQRLGTPAHDLLEKMLARVQAHHPDRGRGIDRGQVRRRLGGFGQSVAFGQLAGDDPARGEKREQCCKDV
jgi:hypothetical protein